jgi:hypothetical protein
VTINPAMRTYVGFMEEIMTSQQVGALAGILQEDQK